MNKQFSAGDLAFRDEVGAFLRDQLPGDISHKVGNDLQLEREDYVRWQRMLHARGWAGANWPPEYGGTGWTPVQKYIFASECAFAHTPRIVPFGLAMVGPVIYTFGNAQQKARFLPDILASNVWWCQGYSEPNAGSDLALLRTPRGRGGNRPDGARIHRAARAGVRQHRQGTGTGAAANAAPIYLNNRKASIYGGSNEIQRNIIAKEVLGL